MQEPIFSQPRADFVTRRESCHAPWSGTCYLSISPSQISKKALPYVVWAIGCRGWIMAPMAEMRPSPAWILLLSIKCDGLVWWCGGWTDAAGLGSGQEGNSERLGSDSEHPWSCTRSGPTAIEVPWALLGFEPDRRAGGVPQLGGNLATAPFLWVFITWERKSHLGGKFASIQASAFKISPRLLKQNLLWNVLILMYYGSFDEICLPFLVSVGLRNQVWGSGGVEVCAKADLEFHPKHDVFLFFYVCD